jgi:hypothetical protein
MIRTAHGPQKNKNKSVVSQNQQHIKTAKLPSVRAPNHWYRSLASGVLPRSALTRLPRLRDGRVALLAVEVLKELLRVL